MSDWQLSWSTDVSLKPTHLSCLGGGASCPEGAFPWGLLGPGASPWGAPWGASSQEVVPSYLQGTNRHFHQNNWTNIGDGCRRRSSPGGGAPRPIGGGAPRPGGYCVGAPAMLAPVAAAATVPRPCGVMTCSTSRASAPENTPLANPNPRQTLPAETARPLRVLAPPDQQGPEAWGPLLGPPDPQPGPHPDLLPHLPTEPGQYRSARRERRVRPDTRLDSWSPGPCRDRPQNLVPRSGWTHNSFTTGDTGQEADERVWPGLGF